MPILVRAAEREDVSALVRLRLANAERHVQLDPAIYRVPDTEAVRRHFEEVLAAESNITERTAVRHVTTAHPERTAKLPR
ncbi:hypothetical protein Psi02_73950 [Planotetraspora silvatica]|uniref:Uncharacterized protein n=1 Tax=Planotetraspora silvatica TaxID=234614 RepID=A0A8J3UWX9_9ACTN|nr:hypothetical protein [Planotetraspora silvatica]GII50971.1 hypothetical protein Psi02_73950 [Planotetraspora silvatica]